MTAKPCSHEFLAHNNAGKVLICRDCGVVNLHLQNMSLRLDVEQLTALAALLEQASKKVRADSPDSAQNRPRLTLVH